MRRDSTLRPRSPAESFPRRLVSAVISRTSLCRTRYRKTTLGGGRGRGRAAGLCNNNSLPRLARPSRPLRFLTFDANPFCRVARSNCKRIIRMRHESGPRQVPAHNKARLSGRACPGDRCQILPAERKPTHFASSFLLSFFPLN